MRDAGRHAETIPPRTFRRRLRQRDLELSLVTAYPSLSAYGNETNDTFVGMADHAPLPPFPSWPSAFSPQHQTVPSLLSAQVAPLDAVSRVTPVRLVTATGDADIPPSVTLGPS